MVTPSILIVTLHIGQYRRWGRWQYLIISEGRELCIFLIREQTSLNKNKPYTDWLYKITQNAMTNLACFVVKLAIHVHRNANKAWNCWGGIPLKNVMLCLHFLWPCIANLTTKQARLVIAFCVILYSQFVLQTSLTQDRSRQIKTSAKISKDKWRQVQRHMQDILEDKCIKTLET